MAHPTTILDLLASQSADRGAATAMLAPDRDALTYAALRDAVDRTGARFGALGLARGKRIALSLPDGADLAVAMLSAMAWSTCVPLVPAQDEGECATLLRRVRADALVVREGDTSAIVRAALALGLTVVRLSSARGAPVGVFTLRAETAAASAARFPPRPDDVALVALTSGTTSRPKVVPLTHAQLLAGIALAGLTPEDRCLCITPLATRSAIGVSVLGPLVAGASVAFPGGFDAARFVDWLDAFRPTYFSASPTVHAAVIDALDARAPREPRSLRFVRSSSSALPGAVAERLARVTGAPVVQGYGMTEAGSIAHSRLPPGERRAGSVGVTSVTEVRIDGEDGTPLAAGRIGEILVRGAGVVSGYEDDPEADRAAFRDGWFRTGDLGCFDADGYLYVTGRIKEMINRGGLKVAPAEVDALFARHPAVREAATFGVPHPTLGEDVVTAVVLRVPGAATPRELRDFALRHLPAFKVPSSVLEVDALPRGPQAKVQRAVLAEQAGARLEPAAVAPRDAEEAIVAGVFADLLGRPDVGAFGHFFHLGGDSLLAARAVARLAAQTGVELEVPVLFEAPTVAELAQRLRDRSAAAGRRALPPLVPRHRVRRGTVALALAAVAAATAFGPRSASAQAYPNRPVRIVVGQSAGGTPDTLARVLRDQLAERWQQTVIVENRPGAGGTIAADAVAKAPADGYTLLLGGPSNLATAAGDAALPYDPVQAFTPIGRIVRIPLVLTVGSHVPVTTIPELVAHARAHPGKLTYLSFGDGAISSLAFRLVMDATGIDLVEVPYKGSAQALPDQLAGRVDLAMWDYIYIRQHVQSGAVRVLGATSPQRLKQAPDVPTVAEQGIKGYAVESWYGLVAPAGTPPEVLASLVAALDGARRSAAMQQRIAGLGYDILADTPAEFGVAIRSAIAKYSQLPRPGRVAPEGAPGKPAR